MHNTLEVGCCVDRTRVVILVECGSEWLVICGTAHLLRVGVRVIQIIVVIILLLAPDSPGSKAKSTDEKSTTNTSNDTTNNFL